ncbi:hypothetical protein AB0C02_30535 [Micromonospora sp. NPDC048999]|uniref:hypothetical protein n=1 Tax=Micromonospora sp. NPDC048999 TaxID=3155391 RepID=UPI0033C2F72C
MSTAIRTALAAPEPPRRPLTAADLTVGDPVWVMALARWRRGVVTQLARVRVRVRYVDRHGDTRERWFAGIPENPVLHGGLPEPVQYLCASPCGFVCTGAPGQTLGEVRAAHERAHHEDLS